MPLQIGEQLGLYEITSLIANGGQVKFIATARFNVETRGRDQGSAGRAGGEAERISRFQREAELRASLSHSSIAIVRSELHHGSANNVAPSEQINVRQSTYLRKYPSMSCTSERHIPQAFTLTRISSGWI